MAIQEYSAETFESLLSLEAARKRFEDVNGNALVNDIFKPFFAKKGMERRFGLTMLHRHFGLQPDERLVEYNGTSSPWNSEEIPGMRRPQPSIWANCPDGYFRPTEFRYAKEQDDPFDELDEEFMLEFRALLDRHEVSNLFGFCRYPGDDFAGLCEITIGNTNINLKPADWPEDLKSVDTAWFFYEPLWKRGCRCTCNASAPGHPHGTHVYTVSG